MIDFILGIPRDVWNDWGPAWTAAWIITAALGSYALLRQDELRAKYGVMKEAWVIVPLVQLIGVLMLGGGIFFLYRAGVNAGVLGEKGYSAYGAAAICLILAIPTLALGIGCAFFGIRAQYRLVLLQLRSHVASTALTTQTVAIMRRGEFALLRDPRVPRGSWDGRAFIHLRAALVTALIFGTMALLYLLAL